ncbi:GntR family transcriptional regulator [Candidatus Epulonipiscium viviparus]|uniref:GntR family transcriptional regulator n=1 Tax=Candidatus Epulonipiscium viviparus TaxID=420336 RepID=UPI00016C048D|nr:GntR family transcriptional regulator [Candidatus Epulopiscium viviparus]
MQDEKLEYQPLRDIVFQTIRNQILWGELLPGQRLMEIQLGEKLGVSRTPIREAIRRLELEGLIVMVPRKGAYVAPFTRKDIQDVLEVRAALESLAAGLAAQRTDTRDFLKLQLVITEYEFAAAEHNIDEMIQKDVEFHEIIFSATKNDRLIQMSQNIREQVLRYRIAYLKYEGEGTIVLSEHRKILEAIQSHDVPLASDLAMQHINTQCDAILKYLSEK